MTTQNHASNFLKMAQYNELPVYKATYDLLLAILQFTKDCGIIYIYRAGNTIILKPGFNANAGSNFHAYIEECADNFDNRQKKKSNSKSNNYMENEPISKTKETKISTDSLLMNKIQIYPNPASNSINIEISEISETTMMYIFNSKGQMVFSKNLENNVSEFDLSFFNSGMYFINIVTNKSNDFFKIIKK